MKKLTPLILLVLLMLTACQVSNLPRVLVSPDSLLLAPGETARLSASISSAEVALFSWSASQGTLSRTTGSVVDYTAPGTAGTYTITVTADIPSRAATITVVVADAVTAIADPNTPVRSNETIGIVDQKVYKLTVPSGLTQPLIYFELQTTDDVAIGLYDADQRLIAKSNSADVFVGDSLATLKTQAISTNVVCRGPCIIIRNEPGTYYLKVQSSLIATYNLFVYDDIYQDTAEPDDANCTGTALKTSAIVITADAAIETLDDLDCFTLSDANTVEVNTKASTAIRLRVQAFSNGTLLDSQVIGPGLDTYTLNFTTPANGQLIVSGENEAAPAGSSSYSVSIK
ncbi:MAG: PKD domain-containing protein [Trueperaceae bacterium]|nr:PKD domain-containing protein [Trueperaceae bacterium]